VLHIASVSAQCPLPDVVRVRRSVPEAPALDIASAVQHELSQLTLQPGARVAIAVGSRGLHDLADIVGAAVSALRGQGTQPFIVPAMGSHGHATAEGQRSVLAQLGITEDAVGAPVHAGMETHQLGLTPDGLPVHVDALAAAADATLVINRVKPHTDFHAAIESGLAKMTAIGLGNQAGAAVMHDAGPAELASRILSVSRAIVERGNVIGGLAVVEDGFGRTARVSFVHPRGIGGPEEETLLKEARSLMGMLPFDDLDVLVVDELGKNISGSGMDTNVLGRMRVSGVPEPDRPRISSVVVLDVTPDSEGNGYGVGLADFTTVRVAESLDLHSMYTNALTAGTVGTQRVKLPMMLADDRSAVCAAVASSGNPDPESIRLVRVRNTLEVSELLVSPALLDDVAGMADLDVVAPAAPLFEAAGVDIAAW
jgi:hypothetical protein